ncbi:MAG: metallophosphoesterase family protein [Bacillota bacterium]
MGDRDELKKYCRVCGERIPRFYKGSGGKRCAVCLHRTHREHLAGNGRVCLRCSKEELSIPPEYRQAPPQIKLVHLTDLHFGENDSLKRSELLKKWIVRQDAGYILVSGDLTGRAGRREYERAARWIREVGSTGIRMAVVPGNHDIGYWGNVMSMGRQAIGRKYHRWIKIIDRPIEPCVRGPGCVVVGLNSAHGISPTRFFNGYLNRHQRARAREILQATPPGHLKVVFCHHPLVRFADNLHSAMFRADSVRGELMAAGAGLFLWGHQHSFAAAELAKNGEKCYAVQGPTLSGRIRDGNYPGFSVVEWYPETRIVIRSYNVINDEAIEEERMVEYPLRGGTAASVVE